MDTNNGGASGTVNPVRVNRKKSRKRAKSKSARARKLPSAVRKVRRSTGEPTSARAAKLAANLIEFEKTSFASATVLLQSINEQSEKAIRHAVSNASWMPREGQKLIEEWQNTLRRSLKDFSKSIDKSFDLMSKYVARIQAETARNKDV